MVPSTQRKQLRQQLKHVIMQGKIYLIRAHGFSFMHCFWCKASSQHPRSSFMLQNTYPTFEWLLFDFEYVLAQLDIFFQSCQRLVELELGSQHLESRLLHAPRYLDMQRTQCLPNLVSDGMHSSGGEIYFESFCEGPVRFSSTKSELMSLVPRRRCKMIWPWVADWMCRACRRECHTMLIPPWSCSTCPVRSSPTQPTNSLKLY